MPAVTPFDPSVKPARDAAAGDITIQVSRDESSLRATRARRHGGVLRAGHDRQRARSAAARRLEGDRRRLASGVSLQPGSVLGREAERRRKRRSKPGPNNPVGVVWIALNLEHYGLHGTPEPGNVGHTESHGCVRLTNWDAARVAALVKPGTPVHFQ